MRLIGIYLSLLLFITAASVPFVNPTHYGDPAGGCETDETVVQVTGIAGSFCSPDCAKNACPTDVPTGVTAGPQCVLKVSRIQCKCNN